MKDEIKALYRRAGFDLAGFATAWDQAFGAMNYSKMANKLSRDTWKVEDLIRAASICSASLCFCCANAEIPFDAEDAARHQGEDSLPKINNKLRALMRLAGKRDKDIAVAFSLTPGAMRNKLWRNTFTGADLVTFAQACGAALYFRRGDLRIPLH